MLCKNLLNSEFIVLFTAIIITLESLLATTRAWLVLRENFTLGKMPGAMFLLAGFTLSQLKKQKLTPITNVDLK